MINAKDILKKAREGHYAVGQFNVSNAEALKAIFSVAERLKSPVIIGTSEGERKFFGGRQMVKIIEAYKEELQIPIILNADHFKSFSKIKEVVEAGYGAIHFDGSELPFEENMDIAKDIVEYAKGKNENILIEGELGYLRGGSNIHDEVEIKPEDMTSPEEAEQFVEETGIDSLAMVIGNVHGLVKTGNPRLDLNRLEAIKNVVGDKFLVLHGGSGIAEEDIRKAIEIGINKININTELRVAYTNTLKEVLQENPEQTTPYKIFPEVIGAMEKVIEGKIKLFGSENRV